jgi:hypothetical protein
MDQKNAIAVAIAVQTHVLCTCPEHHELFCDSEADPANAFSLALELIRQDAAYVGVFRHNAHALMNLLCEVIAAAPESCPACDARGHWSLRAKAGEEHRA